MSHPTPHGTNTLAWGVEQGLIEGGTIAQADRAARLPFVAGHVALMPDAHIGMGATIGSVIPTKEAIIPSAVGVDIGCGMIAADLGITSSALPDDLGRFVDDIAQRIPAGVGRGHNVQGYSQTGAWWWRLHNRDDLTPKQSKAARSQFGTLGSGNHFLELCLDEQDEVWLVLHSGSRGVGNQLAQRHITEAKGLMKRYMISLEDPDLAYFVADTPEFDAYVRDLLWAQEYAMGNRQEMLDRALDSMTWLLGRPVAPTSVINCHHNYAEQENHNGRNVWITRKGAIRARKSDLGVIPGSMGAQSFIVKGLGNEASYCSCSHGAGRTMSRSRAKKELEWKDSDMAGIAWQGDRKDALLDEHPLSYKPIGDVMAAQADLCEIVHTLHQVANYKGV
jgi:tRNA-splicing ligase RtcB